MWGVPTSHRASSTPAWALKDMSEVKNASWLVKVGGERGHAKVLDVVTEQKSARGQRKRAEWDLKAWELKDNE